MRKSHSHNWRNLVPYKQRVSIKVTEGQTFLKAATLKRLRLLRMMVDGGIDVNVKDLDGQTAIMCVILSSIEDKFQTSSKEIIIEYLLRKGADPNIQDCKGKTALIHCCQQVVVDKEVLQLLLFYKADVFIQDMSGRDVLSYIQKDHPCRDILMSVYNENNVNSDDGPLVNQRNTALRCDSNDLYSYLVLPDNTKKLSETSLTLPQENIPKWSPKMNRRKPFYCVEELDLQYHIDGDMENIVLKCPDIRKMSRTKNKSKGEDLPKVKLSNENGETRLLFDRTSDQFKLKGMRKSLFDWERQMSLDEDNSCHYNKSHNENVSKHAFYLQKCLGISDRDRVNKCDPFQNKYLNECSSNRDIALISTSSTQKKRFQNYNCDIVFSTQIKAHSAPSVVESELMSLDESELPLRERSWNSTTNINVNKLFNLYTVN